ncbi:AI-2E family transporter [Methylobacterium sp. SI9]|uniref:AI-2E family transporter n=1 Tax=Methylobacterium guangdongense TaxID=3138811 RepID=UPI00313D5409
MHPIERPLTGDPSRRRRRACFGGVVLLIALWTARSYLAAVAWAIIIAVAIWPLYRRAPRTKTSRERLVPAVATLLCAAVLVTPLVLATAELGREGQAVLGWISRAQQGGIEVPSWLTRLPILGEHADRWWRSHVSNPAGLRALFTDVNFEAWAAWMRSFGGEIAYRALLAFVTFLTLFALLRDGDRVGTRMLCLAEELLGKPGERLFEKVALAIRGVVNGTVLVAIGEGLLIGVGYWVAGLPQAGLFTLLTVTFAMLPFGAWFAFTAAALILAIQHDAWFGAAGVFGWGATVMLAGDNFVQPAVIGGAARLPLVWTLIGILGGLETFGLVGLFAGPVVMAALYAIWRDWTTPGAAVVDREGRC